jgi:hypothetical protein
MVTIPGDSEPKQLLNNNNLRQLYNPNSVLKKHDGLGERSSGKGHAIEGEKQLEKATNFAQKQNSRIQKKL